MTSHEFISVFDVFKIGVGPSSSHTLGPWRAAQRFRQRIIEESKSTDIIGLRVHLFGSLSLTGKGHATGLAVSLGLMGYDPVTIDTLQIQQYLSALHTSKLIEVYHCRINFDPDVDIVFEEQFLPAHANGMVFVATTKDHEIFSDTYYSIGGGFIIKDGDAPVAAHAAANYPFPINNSSKLLSFTREHNLTISQLVWQNELVDRSPEHIKKDLMAIWRVMLESMYLGCHTEGVLPGNLKVKRRAKNMLKALPLSGTYSDGESWIQCIRQQHYNFQEIVKYVSAFGIGVNEVNAALGRVVTAPTNGSAGVIPAVLMYYLCFVNKNAWLDEIVQFLMVAGEIGSIFKKGSTISAAMGGCQAEIGVSSAMAAAGLAELLGGSPAQCTVAAEIAMEHHLGMTCDPIDGLVQVPCIERNAMGAIKAINAAIIAVDRDPNDVKVSLDNVIVTMWETAQDMHRKYKETSEGGLATAVHVIDC